MFIPIRFWFLFIISVWLYVIMSACLSFFMSVCLSLFMSFLLRRRTKLFAARDLRAGEQKRWRSSPSGFDYFFFICLFVCLYVCLFVSLYVCLSILLYDYFSSILIVLFAVLFLTRSLSALCHNCFKLKLSISISVRRWRRWWRLWRRLRRLHVRPPRHDHPALPTSLPLFRLRRKLAISGNIGLG